jgi:hypothetical protein
VAIKNQHMMKGQNMIGKYETKRKEQKALLKELESIKSLLDGGELIDDDYSELVGTAIKKSVAEPSSPNNPPSNNKPTVIAEEALIYDETNFDKLIFNQNDDILTSDELDIDLLSQTKIIDNEIPTLKEIIDNNPASPLAPGELPGQQSLLKENKKFNESKEEHVKVKTTSAELDNNAGQTVKETVLKEPIKQTATNLNRYQALEKTDNPFLPPHIRKRLSSNIDRHAYAQTDEAISSPYLAKKLASSEQPSIMDKTHLKDYSTSLKSDQVFASTNPFMRQKSLSNDADKEEIIDALINEFMPKIESKLRLRLAKAIEKSPIK